MSSATKAPVYTFKASPYSSHTLLLRMFPEHGAQKRVLDVGCGNGYLSKLLADRGYRVAGIEMRGGYTDAFPPDVELIEADLEAGFPALPDRFEYVMCADILEHLRSPDQLLQEIRKVLSKGGTVIASLPNSGNLWFRLNILLGRFPEDEKGLFDKTHLHFYMWSGWQQLFGRASLRIVEVRPSAIPFSLMVPESMQASAPVRVVESVFYGVARIWMKLFAYQFIVRAVPVE